MSSAQMWLQIFECLWIANGSYTDLQKGQTTHLAKNPKLSIWWSDKNLIKGFLIRSKPNVGPNLMLLVILATFCSVQVVAAAVDVSVIINIVGLDACQLPKGFWHADRNYGVEEQQGFRVTKLVTMESGSKTWLAQRCIFFQKKTTRPILFLILVARCRLAASENLWYQPVV